MCLSGRAGCEVRDQPSKRRPQMIFISCTVFPAVQAIMLALWYLGCSKTCATVRHPPAAQHRLKQYPQGLADRTRQVNGRAEAWAWLLFHGP
ncbi:hypothetical protein BDW62DRAFT_175036 [Aspergillus aurantiobrunneus]